MDFTDEQLEEAARQIDSLLHKLRQTEKTLAAKDNPQRYRAQITLAQRRIEALEVAATLIRREREK